jgi:hypothetical protein
MRTEQEIRHKLEETKANPILRQPPESFRANSILAGRQLEIKQRLATLCWVLGESVPRDELPAYDFSEDA